MVTEFKRYCSRTVGVSVGLVLLQVLLTDRGLAFAAADRVFYRYAVVSVKESVLAFVLSNSGLFVYVAELSYPYVLTVGVPVYVAFLCEFSERYKLF